MLLNFSFYCFVGYPQHVRDSLNDLPLFQNLQMARLCDIAGEVRKEIQNSIILGHRDKNPVKLFLETNLTGRLKMG